VLASKDRGDARHEVHEPTRGRKTHRARKLLGRTANITHSGGELVFDSLRQFHERP